MSEKNISKNNYPEQGRVEIETSDMTHRSNLTMFMNFNVDDIHVYSKLSDYYNTTISFDAGNNHTIKILLPDSIIPELIKKLQQKEKL